MLKILVLPLNLLKMLVFSPKFCILGQIVGQELDVPPIFQQLIFLGGGGHNATETSLTWIGSQKRQY